MGSSSDDLHEIMKTWFLNIVTLQQNIMSLQQQTRPSIHNLEKNSIVIQLIDYSFVYPLGVIEDVIVKYDSFIIACEIYIRV